MAFTTSRTRSALRIGFLTVLLSLLATLAPTGYVQSAEAHDDQFRRATPSNDCAYGETIHCGAWSTNGCTVVPDRIWGVFNFNHACDHHDGCYGGQWASRYSCDVTMWYDMNSSCNEMWSWWHPSRAACKTVRTTYYYGVRALGWHAYNSASINAALV